MKQAFDFIEALAWLSSGAVILVAARIILNFFSGY